MALTPTEIHDRLDGPIHSYFGMTYANYQILHRSLMQSMPVEWQLRAVSLFRELDTAFAHIEQAPGYDVRPARDAYFNELTETEMLLLGVTYEDVGDEVRYYDRAGDEHQGHDHIGVPTGDDPVPHYNRGRTFVAPTEEVRPCTAAVGEG